jgi:periplasmic copper chaperone A
MTHLLRAAALAALIPSVALAEIEVHDAYAISARPDAPSGAAFMVIHNHGGADDRLIGARSAAAARVELHTHIETDGVMQMTEIEGGLPLPTDGEILMERGADHVMFMGLTSPWEDGATIDLILIFEVAGEVPVTVPVDRSRLGGEHGGMDHSAHGAGG